MIRRLVALATICLTTPAVVQARPVSYTGGWTFIETSNRVSTAGLVHYTINPKVSLGLRHERMRDADTDMTMAQGTWLVKRWFGKDYQANVYTMAGVGTISDNSGISSIHETGSFIGVMADWETRSKFVSYESRFLDKGALGSQSMHAARVGWAPYEGDTGALHTWLMVEIDHREQLKEETTVTPLVRFFKGAALLELGYNLTDPSPLINFTYRF